jgi:hypothetical protein
MTGKILPQSISEVPANWMNIGRSTSYKRRQQIPVSMKMALMCKKESEFINMILESVWQVQNSYFAVASKTYLG